MCLDFGNDNVLDRPGIDKIDDGLVNKCIEDMRTNAEFVNSKKTLLDLVELADGMLSGTLYGGRERCSR